jgi:DNA helicase HerA-like ATPase
MIDNIYNITEAPLFEKNITVFCLKDCNLDAKKFVPLLTAIQCYKTHKDSLVQLNKKTFHLVIDEAHNILSDQSNRETETWKDYRLEVFEEIIKEGRKFGFFLTIASQRPADISATIVSQIHNYFVHRLVNEKDLYMMTSTISNLDTITKQKLPSLGPGQCIMLGTSFKFPILVQVEKLDDEHSPKSETVDLEKIWYYDDFPF